MKNRNIIKKTLLLSSILLLLSCKEEQKATVSTDAPIVEVTSISSLRPSKQVVLPGELKPWNKTKLHSKVKGFVGQVYVDRGDIVKRGQVLALLEAPEIISELNHGKAKVASAAASLIEQQSKQQLSRFTYKRILETSRTEGAVSPNELDLSYAQMLADSAHTKTAEENWRAAEAQWMAQSQLVDYLSVRAPFDGIVTERNVSPGALVGSGGNDPAMFVVEDRSKLRLTIAIPENLVNSIQKGSQVFFSIQANPLRQYRASFGRMSNSVQEINRTMTAEFDFDNEEENLKAGMYAEVKIPVTRDESTLFVLRESLVHSTEGVFLVRVKNNTAEWVSVRKGNQIDSLVEVFGNINEGDKIIRHVNEELRNGQTIKLK
jgi:membrane fusion protein (multidrug efflux system)